MEKDVTGGHRWWQTAIIYQVYPRSFQDSNRDGIGDLPGIIERLDYLRQLGIGAIWLSPIYPSPMHDFGYDVSDYCAIHPMFGSMEDFDRLLAEIHARGLRLILDLVPNHTSDEHPWFVESRSSRDNPKRDWYIWRDPPPGGGVPNNWLSVFGGPAWTFDEQTGQYYHHGFVRQQPDLNFRNPEVLEAILGVMRFWLDRKVDGFRIDVIPRLIKDDQVRDEPPDPDWDGVDPYYSFRHIYTKNVPGLHDIIRRMRSAVDDYPDRVVIGETWVAPEYLMDYYGVDLDECHLPFNFRLIEVPWTARIIREIVDTYELALPPGAWPNWVLGNHDRHRIATRAGDAQARIANMLLLTLRGTPTTYYGEEIGMENVEIPPEYVQDPPARLQPEIAHVIGRDPVRTPMQWDSGPNAGFTAEDVTPWLPLPQDYRERNVLAEERDPTSMLSLYKRLAGLRSSEPALLCGEYAAVETADEDVFAYTRTRPGSDSFLVVLNMGPEARTVNLGHVAEYADIAVASDMTRCGQLLLGSLGLSGNEGLVLRLPHSLPTEAPWG